jgi:quercetin dioxygenase-like cupin family protein
MPLLERQRIIGEQAMISRVLLRKGFVLATHSHANEQFGVVLSGRVRFGLGAENSPSRTHETLGPGEVIHFPGNFPHSAEALEETLILDIFSPPSEKTGIDAARH